MSKAKIAAQSPAWPLILNVFLVIIGAHYASRPAHDRRVRWYILDDHGSSSNNTVIAYFDIFDNTNVRPNVYVIANTCCVFMVATDRRDLRKITIIPDLY